VILGILLALGIFIRFAAVHINVMVLLFAIVTYYAVSRNLDLSCGCFGGLWDMKFSWYHLLFLFFVFALNMVFILAFSDTWSLEKIIKNKLSGANKESAIKISIIVFMVLGVILIIIASLFNFTNWGRNIKNSIAEKISLANITGENETSIVKTITVDEAYQAYISEEGYIFLDVRNPGEYEQGHIKGAILIPVTEILERITELPENKPIIAYCNGSACNRSGKAAEILLENGFVEVYDLVGGGVFEWKEKGYPFETGE
jgi:rhodanese-related sulfurtransferase